MKMGGFLTGLVDDVDDVDGAAELFILLIQFTYVDG